MLIGGVAAGVSKWFKNGAEKVHEAIDSVYDYMQHLKCEYSITKIGRQNAPFVTEKTEGEVDMSIPSFVDADAPVQDDATYNDFLKHYENKAKMDELVDGVTNTANEKGIDLGISTDPSLNQ